MILFLVLLVSVQTYSSSADISNCYLDDVSEIAWMYGYNNQEVQDTFSGILKTFTSENIEGIRLTNVTYLSAYLKDDQVIVYTTKPFTDFEQETPYSVSPTARLDISLICTEGERNLAFAQPIRDTNNNAPYFSQDEYVFRFAMDVPTNLIVTDIFEVKATDVDVSNRALTFTFDEHNEYLSITNNGYEKNKTFAPVIKTQRAVHVPFRESFTLTVTDDGTPPLTSTATITLLLINPEDVVPSPIFKKSVYVAYYARDTSTLNFDENISLRQGQGNEYQISQKELEEYISVKFEDVAEGTLKATLLKIFPDELIQEKYVIINITAQNDKAFQKGKTSILIYFV